PYASGGRGVLPDRRAGQLAEGDDAPDEFRPDVVDRVPKALGGAAVALQPGPGIVDFQDDHFLRLAPMTPQNVQTGPGRLVGGVGPVYRLLALTLRAAQAVTQDAQQIAD